MAEVHLIKERLPYSGRSADEVVNTVRTALGIAGIQKIVLDRALEYVLIERLPNPGEAITGAGVSYNDAIRQLKHLEEYLPEGEKNAYQQLFEMFSAVSTEKLEVCCLLVGETSSFQKWIGIPRRSRALFGIPIIPIVEIPATTLLVCGAETRDAEPQDILFAIKGELP